MAEVVDLLGSLADYDARTGGLLGKCMREAAAEIERLRALVDEAGAELNAALTYIPSGAQRDSAAELVERLAAATE